MGSTVAYLRACLEAAGHKVHVYTSPHLVRFNERIRLAGRLIEDQPLAALLAEVLDANGDDEIRSEEHTSELQSLMRTSYAVFCSQKKTSPSRYSSDQHTTHT